MVDGPAPEPSEYEPAGLEEWPDPDDREVLSDGSGGTLVETEGEGPRRVVAERDVDEVFEHFEEDSPEEVMAADDHRHLDADESLVEGDIEGLFGDFSSESGDGDTTLRGHEPEPVVGQQNVDEVVEAIDDDRPDDDLFDDREGHKRVVGDSDVDEVFDRYVEDDPEDVIEANDPALESPTEAELRSIGRPDDPLGDLPDPPEDARDSGVGAFVGDGPETMERTGEDTHRPVGETDVDAVFDDFEEDSVEEVIESAEADPEDDVMVETAVDEHVEALFGDMSDVDLEASPVPETGDDDGPSPAPSPEETADAIEGLLTDLEDVDLSAGPSPEETADAIEGLLADLSGLETETSTPMTDETARASGPEFGPEDRMRSDLDDAETDVTSGVAVNRVASDDAVDVSATDLYCAFAGDGPVDTADDLEVGGGWATATGPEAGDVTGRELLDVLADRVEEPPATVVTGTSDSGEEDVPEIELAAPATDDEREAEVTTGGEVASTGTTDGEFDVPEIDLDEPTTAADATTADAGTRPDDATVGENDVPEIDLTPPETDTTVAEGSGAATTERESTGKMAETDDEHTNDVATASNEPNDREPTSSEEVEELFARYEEDTPEEIIASTDDRARGDEPDDAIVGDVEGLFDDLSEVDLEPSGAPEESSPTADATTGRAPDSEAAVEEVEEMFANLDSVNVEPSPVDVEPGEDPRAPSTGAESSPTASGSRYDVDIDPAHERDDHILEERDVDAVFDDFEEETVDEVIEREETAEPARADDGDEPAEVETGDFMKQLAEGKEPEEMGITLYDGSQVEDDGGTAIAESTADGPSMDGPSIESPSPRSGDGQPSIENPTRNVDRTGASDGPSLESPGSNRATGGEPSTGSREADGSPTNRDDEASGRDGPSIEAPSAGASEDDGPAEATTADLFEEMTDATESDEDAWATVADESDPDDAGRSDDSTGSEPVNGRETGGPEGTSGSNGSSSAALFSGDGQIDGGSLGADAQFDGVESSPQSPGSGNGQQYAASDSGPGSETLFPAETDDRGSNGPDDGSVVGALKLLLERIGDRLRDLF
jgi:hypothetical protein